MTPIDHAALALVPLLVEARTLFRGTGIMADERADKAICDAFDALTNTAETASYRLLKQVAWNSNSAARDLMNRIDDALDRAAQALGPLLLEARTLFERTGLKDSDADEAICKAFVGLVYAAETTSDLLRSKAGWGSREAARDLMLRIDGALEEFDTIVGPHHRAP